jgi:signal transduction histidine kinase
MAKMPASFLRPPWLKEFDQIGWGERLSNPPKSAAGDPPIGDRVFQAKAALPLSSAAAKRKWEDRTDESALAPAVGYECDGDLTVISVSANVTELLGIRQENLLGNRTLWTKRLVGDDQLRLAARAAQLEPGALASEMHQLIDDRGLQVWVAHSFCKIRTENGALIRGRMIPLAVACQSKWLDSRVIAEFIHKIGNHFQLINLVISSLARGGVAERIETLQETVDRAVEFTQRFACYSEIVTHSSSVDLGQTLRSAMDAHAAVFLERRVALEDHVGDSLKGALVICDPVLLELGLRAILENALDATTPGDRVIITGGVQATCLAEQFIARLSIADTGCGMEHGHLQKAVAPFFTSKRERDGLGLSIAARLVELHGGRLSISSRQDRGTEVEVALPLRGTPAMPIANKRT